ncbi:MAG TPA: redoxin domain-containing protein [Ardenticatenaceae bacterium]|nr:redoxin domain-containing protein [Ardenticatenaceae bacterium]
MGWERLKIRAPEFSQGTWLNSKPLRIGDLVRRGPVLVDFWDYTCVNCLRTLPYLLEWHERYSRDGLTIVGVHAPEFGFAHDPAVVAEAAARLGIEYPILLDNNFALWSAYGNRAWPSKYLVDTQRIIRYSRVGEGRYGETERAIQTLLREQQPELELPEPLEPLRSTDVPGAVCYPTTPELHAGYAHGRLGNTEGWFESGPGRYAQTSPAQRVEGHLYFEGGWQTFTEYSRAADEDSSVCVPYRAAEINAVLRAPTGLAVRVYLLQDGQPLDFDQIGEDVVKDSELGTYLTVAQPRMYNLVINPDFGDHTLCLHTTEAGLEVYSFTFVSCVVPDDDPVERTP